MLNIRRPQLFFIFSVKFFLQLPILHQNLKAQHSNKVLAINCGTKMLDDDPQVFKDHHYFHI